MEVTSEDQASNKNMGKRKNSHYQQMSSYEAREIHYDEEQTQRVSKAFRELQNYADFQRILSKKVHDDIEDERYSPFDPRRLEQSLGGDYFSCQPFVHPSLQLLNGQRILPFPVIIPQRRLEDSSRGWVRAYAPVLMDCDIDQSTFLNFLDGFNESTTSCPYMNAVNIAGLGVGFAPGTTPMIPIALNMAKTAQMERDGTDFLTRANEELFRHHGLFAMVITYKPTDSQSHQIDLSETSQFPNSSQSRSRQSEPQLPTSAPLIFFESEKEMPETPPNKLRQLNRFIAEYVDRRAQARCAIEQPEPALSTPNAALRSRWGDSNESANHDRLALVHGKAWEGMGKRREGRQGDQSPRQQNRRPLKGLKGIVMKKDMLYLLITSAPPSSPTFISGDFSPLSINMTDLRTPDEELYRPSKRVNSPVDVLEPHPFQPAWAPHSAPEWYSGRSPAFESPQTMSVYGRDQTGYCVPTL